MQIVSDDWKNAHTRPLLNETFVEVALNIADPKAIANASSQDNGAIYISDSSELTDGLDTTPIPYGTLEQNIWCLDGGRKALPESNFGENGYVGDVLSDETCVFSTKLPTITISFTEVFKKSIPGITIVWSNTYNEFADTFEVIAYKGDTIVASKEVTGNRSVTNLVLVEIPEYNKIVIIVKKWCLPYHRVRVEDVYVGLRKVYGKSKLFDYSHKQTVDPVSTSLPKFEIKFSIDNLDGEYNPHNAEGLSKFLMERQEIKAKYGMKMDDGSIKWIKGGTFYLSEWYAKQNGMTADFTARDLLEFMSGTYHDDAYITNYNTIKSQGRSLASLAESILSGAELPSPSDGSPAWVIDESLGKITTKAPLPVDTRANCLQLIANAGECVIYPDRNGTIRIEPLKFDEPDYSIDSFNSYSKSEITLAKPIKQVNIKVHTYSLEGNDIKDSSTEVVVSSGTEGETITVDNPLVTDTTRAQSLGEWLTTHLGHRMTLDSSWRADVRLDALDLVTNKNDYNTQTVRMTDVEFKYNGAFRGTGKGKVI